MFVLKRTIGGKTDYWKGDGWTGLISEAQHYMNAHDAYTAHMDFIRRFGLKDARGTILHRVA